MLPDLKTPLLWALGLGLVAALAIAGIERTRAADARTDAATAHKDLAEYRATAAESGRMAERAQRNQEQIWRTRVDGVIQDGQQKVAAARADAASAAGAERRVRDQLASFRAVVRAASAAPAAAEGGTPASDPIGVLADVLGRADRRAGILAAFADDAHAAGVVCERHADATQP